MNARLAVAAVLLAALPASSRAAPGQSLALTTGLETYFDDNILNYSEAQIAGLESGLVPYRYGVSQAEDVVFRPSLGLLWQVDRGGERRRSLAVRGEGEVHRWSEVANWGEFGVAWREGFSRGRRLSLTYERMPNYYLRRLYDEDLVSVSAPERYQDVTLDQQSAGVSWRHGLPRTSWLDLGYRFVRRTYPDGFRERDSDSHEADLAVGRERLPRAARLSLTAGFRTMSARAEDGDDPPGTVPNEPDLSFHGFAAGVRGGMDLGTARGVRIAGDVRFDLERKWYDSDRPADESHYGRRDFLHGFEVGLSLRPRGPWSARAFYSLQNNRAVYGSTARPGSEIGGYRVNQVGLALERSVEIWSRAAAHTP